MNHLNFEYVPLTFISNEEEIRKQIRNTLILIHLFEKYKSPVRLEKLIEGTQYGYNASALESGKNKFLRISDIYESKVNWATVPFCNCEEQETYLLKKDDILVARTGGTTGKSFKIDNPPMHSIYAGYLIRIRAKVQVNPDYIYLFLHSFTYWSQIVNLNEKNFRPKANAENLKALILPNCPKNIQDEIVKLSQGQKIIGYEDLCSKIEKTLSDYEKKKEIENLLLEQLTQIKNLKQAILREAVQGKLSPQNLKDEPAQTLLKRIQAEKEKLGKREKTLPAIKPEEIPFQIPETWMWCRLDDICSKIGSGSTPRGSNYSKNGFPFFRSQNIYNEGLVYDDIKFVSPELQKQMKGTAVFSNDILLNITGGSLGRCALVPNDFKEANVSQHVCILRPLGVNENFLHKVVLSPYFQKFVFSSTTGAGREGLPKYNLERFLVPLPPLPEQKRIVTEIEKQLAKTKQLREHIIANQQATEQLLKALLHQAFKADHEPQLQMPITKSSTVNDIAFWQHQLIVTYIKILKEQNSDMLQGEMGLVKYGYLDVVINKTKAPFTFRPWIFGPYTEEIKEILHSNTEIFTHKKVGNKGFEVYDLAKASDKFTDLKSPELQNVAKGFQKIVDVFKPFSKKERTRQLELVACVCWLIEKLQTLNITAIYQGMKDWATPKREQGKNKAEIFTKLETVAAIVLIKEHQWHKKLLK